MDSMAALMKGYATRFQPQKVFDWNKAAQIVKDSGCQYADAGLSEDLSCTCGVIYSEGDPFFDDYTYLASTWATPVLIIDGQEYECWVYRDDSPGWDCDTKWPQTALDVICKGE